MLPPKWSRWGPACPDPALRAWGQQAVNRLQNDHETRVFPVQPLPGSDEEGEHAVIGRLIRRMRISDPPARFQALATNVLKASLGMAAVAWVPSEPHVPVVVSGEIEGLRRLPIAASSLPASVTRRSSSRTSRRRRRR